MLKKVIAIKNVGRFRNSAAPGNPQLVKRTFVTGVKAYGKTAICAIRAVFNHHLIAFNAGFSISETKHTYGRAADYFSGRVRGS